jgi:formylglycine-generating enzyme required for sulfatase activity
VIDSIWSTEDQGKEGKSEKGSIKETLYIRSYNQLDTGFSGHFGGIKQWVADCYKAIISHGSQKEALNCRKENS